MFTETFKSKRSLVIFIFGVVLTLVGLLGFVNDPVLGIFEVNTLHNLIHLGSGLFLLLYGAKNFYTAKKAGLILGIIYTLVTVLGFLLIQDVGKLLGLVEMNFQDNFLHLFLSIVFLGLGLV